MPKIDRRIGRIPHTNTEPPKLEVGIGLRRVHVMSRGHKWAVKRSDRSRASRVFLKKVQAICYAKNRRGVAIIVHRLDGTVEKFIPTLP